MRALLAFKPPIDFPLTLDLGLDWRVLLFSLGVSIVAGAWLCWRSCDGTEFLIHRSTREIWARWPCSLTLEDTAEFFNLVLELGLSKDEKTDLVAFLRCL